MRASQKIVWVNDSGKSMALDFDTDVDLVRTAVQLEFAEALKPWLEVRDLFRIASGDEGTELQGEATYIDREQHKQRVGFHLRALSFEQEGEATAEAAIENALRTFSELNARSRLPELQRVRMDAVRIAPSECAFAELRSLVGQAYFRPTALSEQATDVGVTFEQDEGHVRKHIRIGPMEPGQLQESYLYFPKDSIPAVFAFIGLGYQWNVAMKFNAQEVREVLDEARTWQESTVQCVLADLSGAAGG